jgi:hypothetical protein
MRAPLNSLSPVFRDYKPLPVSRAQNDNALLASCEQVHGYVAKGSAVAFAYGVAIGSVWFLCVAYRAGALVWAW